MLSPPAKDGEGGNAPDNLNNNNKNNEIYTCIVNVSERLPPKLMRKGSIVFTINARCRPHTKDEPTTREPLNSSSVKEMQRHENEVKASKQ